MDVAIKELGKGIKVYEGVFRNDLPNWLPPLKTIDHENNLLSGWKPSKIPLLQLSPAEFLAVKENVVDLLGKGIIPRSESPYSASPFMVKAADKRQKVVDCRELYGIRKKEQFATPEMLRNVT